MTPAERLDLDAEGREPVARGADRLRLGEPVTSDKAAPTRCRLSITSEVVELTGRRSARGIAGPATR
jgi:hypothetical protein